MLHPIPSLMNVNRTDMGENYDYYMAGITPSIAKLVSACDAERLAVCRALGLEVPSLVHSLQKMYKLDQVEKASKVGKYGETFRQSYKWVPDDLKEELTPEQLGKLVDSFYECYGAGKNA